MREREFGPEPLPSKEEKLSPDNESTEFDRLLNAWGIWPVTGDTGVIGRDWR